MPHIRLVPLACSLFASLAVLPLLPVRAAEYFGESGGWDVVQFVDEGYCSMAMEYEGPGSTEFSLGKWTDGGLLVFVTNGEWSAKDDEKYNVSYKLNGTAYGGAMSLGSVRSSRSGFATKLGKGFEQEFAQGSSLSIFLDDTRIDQLSLSGTMAGVDLLNKCVRNVETKLAAIKREKERWDHLPKNPFATAKPVNAANLAPVPRGNHGRWVNASEYPSQALAEGRVGRVTFRISVDESGRATNCQILESSGHSDLDDATCTNISRRARFVPATDQQGEPVEGRWESSMTWSIPK